MCMYTTNEIEYDWRDNHHTAIFDSINNIFYKKLCDTN